jgi:glycosyltransferase involved in cell wall biosynthesis
MTIVSKPRLALGIPARNAARHLPRLLESVRTQSKPFDEVLLYDDASSDDTGSIAEKFGAMVIRSDVNTGPSLGKNVLARKTRCEWVHFHDADEALYPEFVERAQKWVGRDDVDAVLFGTEDRDDLTGNLLGDRNWNDRDLQADPIRYCVLNTVTNCGVYRRTAFLAAGGFDTAEATKYNEDRAMHLRMSFAGLRFRADDYIGVIVYRRANSMSSGHPLECARACYQVLAGVADRTGHKYAQEIGQSLWSLAGVLGGHKDWQYARKCIHLAHELGYHDPRTEDVIFRVVARLSGFGAVVAREVFIRTFKPRLRRSRGAQE